MLEQKEFSPFPTRFLKAKLFSGAEKCESVCRYIHFSILMHVAVLELSCEDIAGLQAQAEVKFRLSPQIPSFVENPWECHNILK